MTQAEKVVYFAGAIRGDRSLAREMSEMIGFIKNLRIPVLTEHITEDDPVAAFAEKLGKRKEDLTAEDIEEHNIEALDRATHIIAEISGASTGTGREIEYGRVKEQLGKVPAKILCLYRKDREWFASPMIRGMLGDRYPNVRVASYIDTSEAITYIYSFLLSA